MSYKFNNDRGIFENSIELKYIQLPHEVYEVIFRDFNTMPEGSRMLALWHFIYHFYTNSGYESLKMKDMNAYLLCNILDSKLGQLQNVARWRCFDEFYRGRDDLDYEAALELNKKDKAEKRKERNKRDYQKRKLQAEGKDNNTGKSFDEVYAEDKANELKQLKEFTQRHNLNMDI